MPEGNEVLGVVRFGRFELSVETGELRKNGIRVKLSGQAIQVLAMLAANPGKMVSREELQQKLWPGASYGDPEHGLNAAVNKLRDTLGDAATEPKYIETVPGRGYRFIATVDGPVGKDAGDSKLGFDGKLPAAGNSLRVAVISAFVLLLILVGVAYWRSQPKLPVVSKVTRITNDGRAKNPLNPPVTDGVHLYFTEGMPYTTGSGIAQVSAAGGETTWLTTSLQDVWAVSSISPDRSQLFVAKGATADLIELWAQPLPGGAPHRVGNLETLLATWTPDGRHIVYGDGDKMMVANGDGSEPRQLAKVPGFIFSIRYSPDGERVRFDLADTNPDGPISIWEMDANGKNIHPVFANWKASSVQGGGNWSPDGHFYYFQAGRADAQSIWVMRDDDSIFRTTKIPSRLTSGPLRFGPPVPSTDGKRLFVLGEEPRVELLRYDLKARRLDPYLAGLAAASVDFSPDEQWIAYVSYPDMTLWRSRLDGREKIQLTSPPLRAYAPRWSPDGSQIAFTDVSSDTPWKIRLVPATGGSAEVIVQGETDVEDPTWTPDGKAVVFSKNRANGGIYRLDLNSKKISQIPNSDGLFSPRLSPGGRYISALTVSMAELKLFDTTTERWSSLAEGVQLMFNEWSHDRKYIYFRGNQGGAAKLLRVRIVDSELEEILNLKDFPQRSDVLSLWLGLAPDDAPILMRDRSVQEIYALELQFP